MDPTHTVFASDVKKHAKICNTTTDEKKRLAVRRMYDCRSPLFMSLPPPLQPPYVQLPYIVHGINSASAPAGDAAALAALWGDAPQTIAVALAGVDLSSYCKRILAIGEAAAVAPTPSVLTDAECGKPYRAAQTARSSKAADARHINQQVSIVANLQLL